MPLRSEAEGMAINRYKQLKKALDITGGWGARFYKEAEDDMDRIVTSMTRKLMAMENIDQLSEEELSKTADEVIIDVLREEFPKFDREFITNIKFTAENNNLTIDETVEAIEAFYGIDITEKQVKEILE